MRDSGASFSRVDEAQDLSFFFRMLDRQAEHPAIKRVRAAAREMLAPAEGQRILDVGCGTGEVARDLAATVAPSGSVLAVDLSERMLEEARRRTEGTGLPVEYRTGDAAALDVAAESFDAAHSERTLQHVGDAGAAFARIVQAVRPGGRIVVADTDWDTAVLGSLDVDLNRRITHSAADRFTSGTIGRRLYGMFVRAGCDGVRVQPETIVYTGGDGAIMVEGALRVVAGAVEARAISEAEAKDALESLRAGVEDGTFFMATTMFVVGGTKTRP